MTFTLRSFDIFSLWLKIIGLVSDHATGRAQSPLLKATPWHGGVKIAVLRKSHAKSEVI